VHITTPQSVIPAFSQLVGSVSTVQATQDGIAAIIPPAFGKPR
jgi:hypothetical protein